MRDRFDILTRQNLDVAKVPVAVRPGGCRAETNLGIHNDDADQKRGDEQEGGPT